MGDWGHKVGESDTFADVYDQFFDLYNEGASPELVTKRIREELAEYFTDYDDLYDAHFALAFAQWETQSLDALLLKKVEDLIESGTALKNWEERDASEANLKKRGAALNRFLKKLRKPRPSKKRRMTKKFDFSQRVLVDLPSPDGKKTFSIAESYGEGEYIHTGATIMWANGGGSIFHVRKADLEFSGKWIDSHNLEINIPKSVKDEVKNDRMSRLDKAFFNGDLVTLHCRFI